MCGIYIQVALSTCGTYTIPIAGIPSYCTIFNTYLVQHPCVMDEHYKCFLCNVRPVPHRVVFFQISPATLGAKGPFSHTALRLTFQLNWPWITKNSFFFLPLPTAIQKPFEKLQWTSGTRNTPDMSKRTLRLVNFVATSCLYLPASLHLSRSNSLCRL